MLRMNRSIKAEASFAETKNNLGLKKYMCSGNHNVLAESILITIATNINKLHNKIQSGRTGTYL